MPSLGDSIFIFMLALMLFGPKKLPQLARQLGKLMAEFRRASNEFRMQMEDELRIEEQKDHQKKVDALAPPPSATPDPTIPTEDPPHPHMPVKVFEESAEAQPITPEPVPIQPIAESGSLKMMPPSTGLPIESPRGTPLWNTSPNTIHDAALADPAHTNGFAHTETSLSDNGPLSGPPVGPAASSFGISSEDPVAETALEPAPDRSHPAMVGEGERATHA